jgi:hypothetical protein
MRWRLRGWGLGLALLAIASCAGGGIRPEALQSWVGRPAAALEQAWGPPTRQVRDGDRRLLVYEEITQSTRRDFETPVAPRYGPLPGASYDPQSVRVYVRSYLFWVNGAGVIEHATRRDP